MWHEHEKVAVFFQAASSNDIRKTKYNVLTGAVECIHLLMRACTSCLVYFWQHRHACVVVGPTLQTGTAMPYYILYVSN